MHKKLTSKIAIVTGAAQGIGAAIAQVLAQEDCTVYLTDINDELGNAVTHSLGGSTRYLRLDVRLEEDWLQRNCTGHERAWQVRHLGKQCRDYRV